MRNCKKCERKHFVRYENYQHFDRTSKIYVILLRFKKKQKFKRKLSEKIIDRKMEK